MQITQRQATLGILAVHVLGAALFALSGLFQSTDVVLPLASGLDGVLTLGLLLAVWRGWYAARYIEIILTTLLIGALIPDPERSAQLDTAMYIAPVLALILADARWVVGTVVMLLAIVLIRTGGQGVYADPGSLIVYGVAIGGMVLASRVMVTAQRLAETNARQAELQAAELARYNIELARLNQLSARLQVCPTVVEATQIIAETLVDLFPTSSGTLYVRNQAAQEFHATARWGSNPPQAQVLSAISSE
jgi:hypothetical protein